MSLRLYRGSPAHGRERTRGLVESVSMMKPRTVSTARLETHVLEAGERGRPVVILLHGNISTGAFFDVFGAKLAERFHVLAPDLRGFGDTEAKPIDATRGVRDFSDDVAALLAAEDIDPRDAVVVGWSVGGSVAMQLAIDHGAKGLVLLAPSSPYGFGGTHGPGGTPCHADYAGSGGGTANPRFVELLAAADRGDEDPSSPRNVLQQFFWKAGFALEEARVERYLDALLQTRTGPDFYPGDTTTSEHWPGVAPGERGMNNAISAKYLDQSGLADIDVKPPILWIRGADDQIVSDNSMFDFGVLGKLGAVPGWPGDDVYPGQPMVSQTRAVLEAYAAGGGAFREEVLEDCGHSPHLEREADVLRLVTEFVSASSGA